MTDVDTVVEPRTDPGALLDGACHQPFEAAWRDLAPRLDETFVELLRTSLAAHREVIDRIGLEGEPPADWSDRSNALLEYRKALSSKLLEPWVRTLEGKGPAVTTARAAHSALEAAVRECEALPSSVSAPWPEGALQPRASDSFRRRWAKVLARVVSAARKAGEERELPLRAVARRHLAEVVAPAQDALTVEAMTRWAEWTRSLEIVWTEWGDAVLPDLVRSEMPDEETASDLWITVRDGALTLQGAFEALIEQSPDKDLAGAASESLTDPRASAEADLAVAGSFLLRPTEDEVATPELTATEASEGAHDAWEDGVAARFRMYQALLAVLAGATGVQRRMLARFRTECLEPMSALPEISQRLEALAEKVRASDAAVPDRIQALVPEVESVLAPAQEAIPGPDVVDSTIVQGADATVEALLAIIRQAPTALKLHHERARLPSARRRAEARPLGLQELARQSFDALRIERIRASTLGLAEGIAAARGNVGSLHDVFSFAHEAALSELEEAEEGAEERAIGLVTEALQSMADSLRLELRNLEEDVDLAQERLASEISDGSLGLVDRVAAGRMQAQLLAARSWVSDFRAKLNETLGPPLARAGRRIAIAWAVTRRFVTRGVERGTALVGGAGAEAEVSARTVKALADARKLIHQLPLVYQRLFTLEPITDPALLTGREGESANGLTRFERWQSGDGVPLIVKGRQGCGITSFLNVLAGYLEDKGATVARVSLRSRVSTEPDLVTKLAGALDLESSDGLDELASAVFRSQEASEPRVLVIDNLEHLYLRVPDGTALVERMLTFMAETEPRIFWIGGVTASAWQIIATAEPTAVSQVDVLDLQPLPGEAMRRAIEARHRRSGLSVRFEEPEHGRRLLKRRLRKIRDPDAYHAALQDDFFQQLVRASDGHLQLALFQWMAAAEFEEGGEVLMHTPKRPDFSLLDGLALTQNFTLKAFLEHRTLSLDEHDRIFRLPRHESYQIFESLQNRHLIEAVRTGDDAPRRSEIAEDLRYRVRPLLMGAVVSHLRGRNIVH